MPISDLAKLTRLPVTAEWFTLGIQLGLSPDRLRTIQSDNVHYPDTTRRCLIDMFSFWITSDCISTYEGLETALNAIDRNDLALEVCREKRKYLRCYINISCYHDHIVQKNSPEYREWLLKNRLDFQLSPSCKTAPPVCFILRFSQTCIDHLKVALQPASIVGYVPFQCYSLNCRLSLLYL